MPPTTLSISHIKALNEKTYHFTPNLPPIAQIEIHHKHNHKPNHDNMRPTSSASLLPPTSLVRNKLTQQKPTQQSDTAAPHSVAQYNSPPHSQAHYTPPQPQPS